MIELIVAFLISIGWLTSSNQDKLKVTDSGKGKFGIVVTDETQQRTTTVVYDEATGSFRIQE